jgi:hypothetical protein
VVSGRKPRGRKPKKATGKWSTLTIRLTAEEKNILVERSENWGCSMTEYLMLLMRRDGS